MIASLAGPSKLTLVWIVIIAIWLVQAYYEYRRKKKGLTKRASLPKPTAAEKERFERIARETPLIPAEAFLSRPEPEIPFTRTEVPSQDHFPKKMPQDIEPPKSPSPFQLPRRPEWLQAIILKEILSQPRALDYQRHVLCPRRRP